MENLNSKLPGVGPHTQKILDLVTGKNATFVKRVAKQQLEKYGNDDLFDISIRDDAVTVSIGENWITFAFEPGKDEPFDTYGYGQGCRYHKQMEAIAIEAHRTALNRKLKAAAEANRRHAPIAEAGHYNDGVIDYREITCPFPESAFEALAVLVRYDGKSKVLDATDNFFCPEDLLKAYDELLEPDWDDKEELYRLRCGFKEYLESQGAKFEEEDE